MTGANFTVPRDSGSELLGGKAGFGQRERQLHAHGGADVDRALEPDPAAVALDDRLGDRQPEAGPGDGALERARAAEEALEQLLLLVLGEADAGVLDLDQGNAVRRREAHLDAAARRRALERFRDEVVEHLREPRGIALQRRRQLLREPHELDALRVGGGRSRLAALVTGRVELAGPELEGELARVSLGEEEQVADEVEQPAGVPVDDA